MLLVLNPGSSSLKSCWFSDDGYPRLEATSVPVDWHVPESATTALEQTLADAGIDPPAWVVHRVVHGGALFRQPVLVTPEVRAQIARLAPLAPLHNPISLALMDACQSRMPGASQAAVFDTAFHHTIPAEAATYALPSSLAQNHGVRRYGFHGISHAAVARRTAQAMDRSPEQLNIISLHLGFGASACAISGGRSVDTSMGMTPTEGLVMGTRCGDLDPGAIVHLLRSGEFDAGGLDDLLNRQSGLLGLCGHADMRRVRESARTGDPAARLALSVYVHRLRRCIGGLIAVLGRVDALVFTGGVGENDASLREEACATLAPFGVVLDPASNDASVEDVVRVSAPSSAVTVLAMRANEEEEMVRQWRLMMDRQGEQQ